MGSVVREAFNGVFFLRAIAGAIIGSVGAAAIAYGVSVWVADYISKANVVTVNEWLTQLDGRMDKSRDTQSSLGAQLTALVGKLGETNDQLSNLSKRIDAQTNSLASIDAGLKTLVTSQQVASNRQKIFEGFTLRIAIRQATPPDKIKEWTVHWGLPTDKRWEGFLDLSPAQLLILLAQYDPEKFGVPGLPK